MLIDRKPNLATGDASLRRTVVRIRRLLRCRHGEETVSRTTEGQDSSAASAETRRGVAMRNFTECKTDPKSLGKFIFEKWRAFHHRGAQFSDGFWSFSRQFRRVSQTNGGQDSSTPSVETRRGDGLPDDWWTGLVDFFSGSTARRRDAEFHRVQNGPKNVRKIHF